MEGDETGEESHNPSCRRGCYSFESDVFLTFYPWPLLVLARARSEKRRRPSAFILAFLPPPLFSHFHVFIYLPQSWRWEIEEEWKAGEMLKRKKRLGFCGATKTYSHDLLYLLDGSIFFLSLNPVRASLVVFLFPYRRYCFNDIWKCIHLRADISYPGIRCFT